MRRDPSRSVVNRVLRGHLETFLARFVQGHSLGHAGRTLPAHVERELRAASRELTDGLTMRRILARLRLPTDPLPSRPTRPTTENPCHENRRELSGMDSLDLLSASFP